RAHPHAADASPRTVISEHLGRRKGRKRWLRYEDDLAVRSPVVHFEYPSGEADGFDYVTRDVKLELGSLTDQRPTEKHDVRAWVVDDFPAAFGDWECRVTALELQRTFWEKATILHAEHHRPEDQPTPARYARHYADMARLLQRADASAMLSEHVLCGRVVEWKGRVFARQWARYDLAKPGSFRLVPPPARHVALARDYAQMRAMFLAPRPTSPRCSALWHRPSAN
ncbi:MAG: nucleotidyl transferase AbiEii/AbiGii toxin family protein, partial [Aquincola sp.]|nr:nucleotidyl transferase AbiEii/AbiGii toxin family protein [Aquincola sp.]